jgi:hypothetical protein
MHRVSWRAGASCVALLCATLPLASCGNAVDVAGLLFQSREPQSPDERPQAKGDGLTDQTHPANSPASGARSDVSIKRELPDPGFVWIPQPSRSIGDDSDFASAEIAEEAQERLSRLVRDGTIVELYVDQTSHQGARRFVVQIGSHQSDEIARSYLPAAPSRFDSPLSLHDAAVRKADLGARGVHYRVLIGPVPSARSADTPCGALTRQNRPCIVQTMGEGATADSRVSMPQPTLISAAQIPNGTWAGIPHVPTRTPERHSRATQLADRSPLDMGPRLPTSFD